MTRKNRKPPKPDEHLETLGQLLNATQNTPHRVGRRRKEPTAIICGCSSSTATRATNKRAEIVIRWVDGESQETEPLP